MANLEQLDQAMNDLNISSLKKSPYKDGVPLNIQHIEQDLEQLSLCKDEIIITKDTESVKDTDRPNAHGVSGQKKNSHKIEKSEEATTQELGPALDTAASSVVDDEVTGRSEKSLQKEVKCDPCENETQDEKQLSMELQRK